MDRSFLTWPLFEPRHRALAEDLEAWAARHLPVDHVDAACRGLVARLGEDGWLAHGGGALNVRTLCLIRETLARHDALADLAFARQGRGMGAVSLFGSAAALARGGKAIAAFALTEPGTGSDVAATATTATRVAEGWRIDGSKTWISNGGIADLYVLFDRTGEAPGARGLSALLLPADTPCLVIAERLETIAPHPPALEGVVLPEKALIGARGQGFKIAMLVLDVFRSTVGAAALGLARRALDESLARVRARKIQGAPLAEMQIVQGHLADMAALLVYRATWTKDQGADRVTREAAMAKLYATEAAQEIIDMADQLHGGEGVRRGSIVEALYREIRALRIYEGASDVPRIVIVQTLLEEPS